jgi:hypothetical protein
MPKSKNNPNGAAPVQAAKPISRRKAQRILPAKKAEAKAMLEAGFSLLEKAAFSAQKAEAKALREAGLTLCEKAATLRSEIYALEAVAYGPLPEDESRAAIVRSTIVAVWRTYILIAPIPVPYRSGRRYSELTIPLADIAPEMLAKAYPGAPVEIRFRFYAAEGKWRRSWHAEIVAIGFEHEDLFTSGDDEP